MVLLDVDAVDLDAFALADELEPSRPGAWHTHERHQLLYASSSVMHFEVRSSRRGGALWLLPLQRAAWIPAATPHRVRVTAKVDLCAVYLRPAMARDDGDGAAVFGVSPLARAMLLETLRWGHSLTELPDVGAKFFAALAAEWRRAKAPFCLPLAESPELAKAMRYALDHLAASPTIEDAAKAAGTSTRTLERRFASEARTSWRTFVHSTRMLRALELLAMPGRRVTDVAVELGFESFGAFSTAFQRFTGETPSAYRKRTQAERG